MFSKIYYRHALTHLRPQACKHAELSTNGMILDVLKTGKQLDNHTDKDLDITGLRQTLINKHKK